MRLKQVRDAILSVLKENFPDCVARRPDAPRPVGHGEFTVIVPGFSYKRQIGDSRIKTAEVEIWYRPEQQDSPRDELEKVAEKLDTILFDGFPAGDTWLCPEEEISFSFYMDSEDKEKCLCCQFSVPWVETAREPYAETMKNLHVSDWEMDDCIFK